LNRLKTKEIKDYRTSMFSEQGETCTLCHNRIHDYMACLDHDHKTGHVRSVLCKPCNTAEGKILGWAIRSGSNSPAFYLNELIKYWDRDYSHMPYHPKHLTPTEKEIKRLTKLMRAKKKQETRDKYQVRIDALIEMNRREL